MTVDELVSLAGVFLFDESHDVWTEATKISFVNEAIKAVVLVRPDATATTTNHTLTADTSRQSIPATGARFLHLTRNVATGTPIRKISKEVLFETVYDWDPQTVTEIEFYMFDEEDPLSFDVHPVPDSALVVGLVYSDVPATVASGDDIPLSGIYAAPLLDFVLHRCYGMETKGVDRQKSMQHLQSFFNALGVKTQNDLNLIRTQEA
jgi:hypothetical protein